MPRYSDDAHSASTWNDMLNGPPPVPHHTAPPDSDWLAAALGSSGSGGATTTSNSTQNGGQGGNADPAASRDTGGGGEGHFEGEGQPQGGQGGTQGGGDPFLAELLELSRGYQWDLPQVSDCWGRRSTDSLGSTDSIGSTDSGGSVAFKGMSAPATSSSTHVPMQIIFTRVSYPRTPIIIPNHHPQPSPTIIDHHR